MIRSILFFFLLWLSLLLSLLLFIPFILFKIPSLRNHKQRFINSVTTAWARFIIFLSGAKIKISRIEKPPDTDNLVILSNHQGYIDIPLVMSVFPFPISFIAKKELLKVPLINLWMKTLDCIFIDRKKPIASSKTIRKELLKKERNPVLLFPEGTRSRGNNPENFKRGGLQLVFEARKVIQPVRISGTYNIYEKSGKIKPGIIEVHILKPVLPEHYQNDSFDDFKKRMENIIQKI